MRGRLLVFVAILVASGCAGDDETASETVTVTTTSTVTVTETVTTTTAPPPTTTAPPGDWEGLPQPLPADGTLPVDAFNAYAESVDEPWERQLAGVTHEFIGDTEASSRSFQATTAGEGGSANASLLLDGLFDDSVRARDYDLTLSRRQDGTWRIDTAQWAQRCHEGRGHQEFSPAPCL